MFCTKCGAQNDNGARFCAKCGNDLLSANGGDANTGGSNQNQGTAFNGAGLKYISIVYKDGMTRDVPVKWLPEEFERMNPAQLVQALTEIIPVIDELTGLANKQTNLESECRQLKADNEKPIDRSILAGNGIILLVAVILCFVITWLGIGLLICGLFAFLVMFIPEVSRRSKRKKAYENRYGTACKELDEAKRCVNDYVNQNGAIIWSAFAVLPDYYYDAHALAHMLSSLRNRRATSLGEAVNLFVTDKNAMEQRQLMQAQIYETRAAAENASRAAAAAESAASAADRAATNTSYSN